MSSKCNINHRRAQKTVWIETSQKGRLSQFGHVECKDDVESVKNCLTAEVINGTTDKENI